MSFLEIEGRPPFHEVAQKAPNAWGLYDMHGNVHELCQDYYGLYPPGDAIDPQGPSTGSQRVGRGGSWVDLAKTTRCARRGGIDPWGTSDKLGFRLVMLQ